MESHFFADCIETLTSETGKTSKYFSLPKLERKGVGPVSKLPRSIRVVLESVMRNVDGKKIAEEDVRRLANWKPVEERTSEIPFVVARILLQDFTGVPLLVDLAAMRSAVGRMKKRTEIIEPLVPVDLVIDHSVQVDYWSRNDALWLNMDMEFRRNRSRYQFLKWGMQAFHNFNVVPSGIGICHQVNLEYLAKCVQERDGVLYPDTLVGTDSHTTMVNGLGVVAWGVGGIEAEAGMLGQPVYFLTPDVVGVHMKGALREGATATDLVLHITQMLRKVNVVGKFVEYFGEGAASLTVPDRATIGNMSPEYGATMGYLPVDEETCRYMEATGRTREQVDLVRAYYKAQGIFGMPRAGEIEYSRLLELDLSDVRASVAGPKRPQDRLELPEIKTKFSELLTKPLAEGGFGKVDGQTEQRFTVRIGLQGQKPQEPVAGGGHQEPESMPVGAGNVSAKNTSEWTESEMMNNRPTPDLIEELPHEALPKATVEIGNGDVVIAAITSCTNTSNPTVMLAAGILAKKAVEKGLRVKPWVKPSLAPGSRVVTEYYNKTGLMPYLDKLGFQLVGYGCTTCIGNSGPLDSSLEQVIGDNDLVVASVLSGNRNFEARVHQSVKANFLMSPPLVVAFALAGQVDIDLTKEPVGHGHDGQDVYLRDIWPTTQELGEALKQAADPEEYRRLYANAESTNPLWNEINAPTSDVYAWDKNSTYIQEPPYFDDFSMEPGGIADVKGARMLAMFGESITTDHISPAGAIKPSSAAGKYLLDKGVQVQEFNTYGARRGNHEVMVRGTFANVRIKNLMLPGTEGGMTMHLPDGEQMNIYDAAMKYQQEGVPLMIFGGHEYGAGSSRDWAAKGTRLLGVKAVIAQSFERIHRSNLVGMGVLPCQFEEGVSARVLGLTGAETFDLTGIRGELKPRQQLCLTVHRPGGDEQQVHVTLRIDTPIEVEYYRHGGILHYVLRHLVAAGG
ncbi:MAG TPA: aconitate hydratase [Clostridia bacterium]|nr:aconitate hydratase [Clostridia bacterium]